MSHEVASNIREAKFLHQQAVVAQLEHGCVDISLRALGAPAHLVDMLDGSATDASSLLDVILRRGLKPQWILSLPGDVTPSEITRLLERNDPDLMALASGKHAGHICLISYPDQTQVNGLNKHVMAVLPRDPLPRDLRRKLKLNRAYFLVDTSTKGVTLQVTAEHLADYARRVMAIGGSFEIAELSR